ncbi:excinuclease ABC subunit UvrB [Enterovibrio norvegicus]|uniref:Excinuclease ABC subunit B n=1 Tax=Enterovibrio norvegicus DSM 15893 TaxID=1121869 RepID=A0A1I5SRH8_9GAMM|nr:excinuclease ABC subunit UvrB [Enterovibrio norvegicus]SFP73380.1 Excinuclease ABC subunit B [Enterovibrio norvegicus DSM 15893]
MGQHTFLLHSKNSPAGDQPEAIAKLIAGIEAGKTHQTLRGVTGSGKTFTMANIIHRLQRPTLILAHNKTLAAQLYHEMLAFFPQNAVEYFVSYYDYYQPEVYIPGSQRFIRKDSAVNAQLERLRLSTTKALIERKDVIVVASVSSVYGLGSPDDYRALQIPLALGAQLNLMVLENQLAKLHYEPGGEPLSRGSYRISPHKVEIFPADSEKEVIVVMLDNANVIMQLLRVDNATGEILGELEHYLVSPKTLYSTSPEQVARACKAIEAELEERTAALSRNHQVVEAARLYERTTRDIEMLRLQGYCGGIENYASYLTGRDTRLPPTTLMDYLPKGGLLFIDESHVMVPQIHAMYKGDQSRKDTLIDYGFRLPSAKFNRPLSFEEFEKIKPQTIFVSATPGNYEVQRSGGEVVDQVIRPTGLLDPEIEIVPLAQTQEDLMARVRACIEAQERVLVTTLSKQSAEALYHQYIEAGIRCQYIHSDVKTEDRIEIIRQLRRGELDVLIGINLLREGLDIPEASLVAILNADHAGFLRSTEALIQIIGRAARNAKGKAVLYADSITPAMQSAMDESNRRRAKQIAYNEAHQLQPRSSSRTIDPAIAQPLESKDALMCATLEELCHRITETERELLKVCAENGGTENAETNALRATLDTLYRQYIFM